MEKWWLADIVRTRRMTRPLSTSGAVGAAVVAKAADEPTGEGFVAAGSSNRTMYGWLVSDAMTQPAGAVKASSSRHRKVYRRVDGRLTGTDRPPIFSIGL
jgi:hypothetical protein